MISYCSSESILLWNEYMSQKSNLYQLCISYVYTLIFTLCILKLWCNFQIYSSPRHCTTSRKVVGSIPDDVIWIFHWHPFGHTVARWVIKPLTVMSTGCLYLGGKGGQCINLTTLPPSCAICLEIWEPQPPWALRACPGLLWDCFTFTHFQGFFSVLLC
jgi:hypothetical protein